MNKAKVKFDGTHAGYVNGNYWMYLPSSVSKGSKTFYTPYKKPLTDGHYSWWESEVSVPVFGRIQEAKYVKYDGFDEKYSKLKITDKNAHEIAYELYEKYQKDNSDFKGVGVLEIEANIEGSDRVEDITSERKLTVSIGAETSVAKCSICGCSPDECGHQRGMVYDGKLAFYIAGEMKFDHLAFVKKPADSNALVSGFAIMDNLSEGKTLTDTVKKNGIFYIKDSVSVKEINSLKEEAEGECNMSIFDKFSKAYNDLLSENKYKQELIDNLNTLSAKGRSHSFLFNDPEKTVYIKDSFGLALALKTLSSIESNVEDSEKEDFEAIKFLLDSVLDTGKYLDKTKENFIDSFLSDSMEVAGTKSTTLTDSSSFALNDEALGLLADKIFSRIQSMVDTSSTSKFLRKRIDTLEDSIRELEEELKIKDQKLESKKNVDKTEDKEDNQNSIIEDKQDLEKIVKDNLNVKELNASEGTKVVTDGLVGEQKVLAEYQRIKSEKGLSAALDYIKKNQNK